MRKRYCFLQRRRKFNPQRLPSPVQYYKFEFPEMITKRTTWVNVQCCFHKDDKPSLSVNLDFGGFHCFGCGEKAGDIVAFHQKRYHLPFVETVDYFSAWEYEDET